MPDYRVCYVCVVLEDAVEIGELGESLDARALLFELLQAVLYLRPEIKVVSTGFLGQDCSEQSCPTIACCESSR